MEKASEVPENNIDNVGQKPVEDAVNSHHGPVQILWAENSNLNGITQIQYNGNFERLEAAIINPHPVFTRVQLNNYISRDWLEVKINRFLDDHDRGYLILEAEAGLGKTTFLAWLVQERGYFHHFCEQARGPENVSLGLKSIAAQLIQKFHLQPYERDGEWLPPPMNPSLIEKLLYLAANQISPGQKIVLVVDGLDEAGRSEFSNPLGLPSSLPKDVYIIVSTRPPSNDRLFVEETNTPRVRLALTAADEQNRKDLRRYIEWAAASLEISALLERSKISQERFSQSLLEKSEGVWIFLFYVIHDLVSNSKSSTDWTLQIDDLPQGLARYYLRNWQRFRDQDPQRWDALGVRLLASLAAAQDPMPIEWLCSIVGTSATDQVRLIFEDEWSAFLAVDGPPENRRYRFYHSSLRDFFEQHDSPPELPTAGEEKLFGQMRRAISQAHRQIAILYRDHPEKWHMDNNYALRHLHVHLLRANREGLYDLIERPEWLAAQSQYDPTLLTYSRGVEASLACLEKTSEVAALPRIIAFHLLLAGIGTWANDRSPGILEALVLLGQEDQALRLAKLMVDPQHRFASLTRILGTARSSLNSDQENQAVDQLLAALEDIPAVREFDDNAITCADLLVNMSNRSALARLVRVLRQRKKSNSVFPIIEKIVRKKLCLDTEELIDVAEELAGNYYHHEGLIELAGWFAESNMKVAAAKALERVNILFGDTKRLVEVSLLARAARVYTQIGEVDTGDELLKLAKQRIKTLQPDNRRMTACIEVSRAYTGASKAAWLEKAVRDIPKKLSSMYRNEIVLLVEEFALHQPAMKNLDIAVQIADAIRADPNGLYSTELWIPALARATQGRSSQEFLAFGTQTILEHGSYLFPLIAYSIAAWPDRRALEQLVEVLEQSKTDWVYVSEVIGTLAPVAADLGERDLLERMFQVALWFDESRQGFHDKLWAGLAPAFLKIREGDDHNPKITLHEWEQRLGFAAIHSWEDEIYPPEADRIYVDDPIPDLEDLSEENITTAAEQPSPSRPKPWETLRAENYTYTQVMATYHLACSLLAYQQTEKAITFVKRFPLHGKRRNGWGSQLVYECDMRMAFVKALCIHGYLEAAWQMLGINMESSSLPDRAEPVLQELAKHAFMAKKWEDLKRVAHLAISSGSGKLIDCVAPLLARAGELDLAKECIAHYKPIEDDPIHRRVSSEANPLRRILRQLPEDVQAKELTKLVQAEFRGRVKRKLKILVKKESYFSRYLFDFFRDKLNMSPYDHDSACSEVVERAVVLLTEANEWDTLVMLLDDLGNTGSSSDWINPGARVRLVALLAQRLAFFPAFQLLHLPSEQHDFHEEWLEFCRAISALSGNWLTAFLAAIESWTERGESLRNQRGIYDRHTNERQLVVGSEQYLQACRDFELAAALVFVRNPKEENAQETQKSLQILIARQLGMAGTADDGTFSLLQQVERAEGILGGLIQPLALAMLVPHWQKPGDYKAQKGLFEERDPLSEGLRQLKVLELAVRSGQRRSISRLLKAFLAVCQIPTADENEEISTRLERLMDGITILLEMLQRPEQLDQLWEGIDCLLGKNLGEEVMADLPQSVILHLVRLACMRKDWLRAERLLLVAAFSWRVSKSEDYLAAVKNLPQVGRDPELNGLRDLLRSKVSGLRCKEYEFDEWLSVCCAAAILGEQPEWQLAVYRRLEEEVDQALPENTYGQQEYNISRLYFMIADQLAMTGLKEEAKRIAQKGIALFHPDIYMDHSNAYDWLWIVARKLDDPVFTERALQAAQIYIPHLRREELEKGFRATRNQATKHSKEAVDIIAHLLSRAHQAGQKEARDLLYASIPWLKALGGTSLLESIQANIEQIETLIPST